MKQGFDKLSPNGLKVPADALSFRSR